MDNLPMGLTFIWLSNLAEKSSLVSGDATQLGLRDKPRWVTNQGYKNQSRAGTLQVAAANLIHLDLVLVGKIGGLVGYIVYIIYPLVVEGNSRLINQPRRK